VAYGQLSQYREELRVQPGPDLLRIPVSYQCGRYPVTILPLQNVDTVITQGAVRSLGGPFPSHQRDDMRCSGASLDV
jgi:hypothetical protein